MRSFLSMWCLAVAIAAGTALAAPLGSAITYQGFLSDGSGPAGGQYDFQFKLMTAESGGSISGSPIERDNVAVVGGQFTVELDFGPGYLSNQLYWLEVGVRPDNQAGGYTALAPRQKLTPVPYALNLALPWLASESSAVSLLGLTQMSSGPVIQAINQGTGTGIQANILNAANGSPALAGTTNGSGNAVFGQNSGSGRAAYFRASNTSSTGNAMEVLNDGRGRAAVFTNSNAANLSPVVEASTTSQGGGGSFKIVNAGSTATALYGQTNGSGPGVEGVNLNTTGNAGVFRNTHDFSPKPAVRAINNGTGPAVYGNSLKGRAAYFENDLATNPSEVVRADNAGPGAAVFGFNSGAGAGVRGGSTGGGPAVMAVADNNGTALEIGGGTVRATNAGVNTPTFVFTHVADSSNTSANHLGTVITHPMTDGDPTALLFVMPNFSPSNGANGKAAQPYVTLLYNHSIGKWEIASQTNSDELNIPSYWNVLVFKR